jgi:hypothetical protein
MDHDHKYEVAFILQEWPASPVLYDPEHGGLLFWFNDFHSELILSLGVNPDVTQAHQALFSVAKSDPKLFPPAGLGIVRGDWPTVWSKQFLKASDFEKRGRDQIFDQIENRWGAFIENDMPKLRVAISRVVK